MDREKVVLDRETSLLRETAEDQVEYSGRILGLAYDGLDGPMDSGPRIVFEYGAWEEGVPVVFREYLSAPQQTLQQLEEELRETAEQFPPVRNPYRFEDHFAESGPEYVNVFVREDGESKTLEGEEVRRVLPLPRHTTGPVPDMFTASPYATVEDVIPELEANGFSTFLNGFRGMNAYELREASEPVKLQYFPELLEVTGVDIPVNSP